jgi:NitT/TauT family transport system substrate-binding protein
MRAGAFITLLAATLIVSTYPGDAQTRAKSERMARQGEIVIGVGHGIGFLPLYLAHDFNLLEKHAKGVGLNARLTIRRFASRAPMQQALTKGEVTVAAFGIPAFLLARDASKGTPQEMVAVSGITTLPLLLLTARTDVKSLSDLKPADKIAVPMLTAPQMTYLRMQSNKWFMWGAWNRLRQQVVAMPHQEALEALVTGKSEVALYFSSPPYAQIALKQANVRAILSSADVAGGKASFLVLAARKDKLTAHPKLAEALSKAIDEAANIIRNDPRRAAVTWLKNEPSHSLDARAVEAILRGLKDDFGSGVYGVETLASYLRGDGRLKDMFWSWKDVVAPAIAGGPGS